jgi:hypothetical protein
MNSVRSQNVVERVAEALKQQQPCIDLPVAVIRAASEKYRLLELQVRVGSIQLQPASQKDTSERRAAALLEYCTRQHELKDDRTPLQLPWPALAAAVRTKSHQPIQQLQHILVNFLQPTTLSKTAGRKRPNQVGNSSQNNTGLDIGRTLRHRMHSISYKDGIVASSGHTKVTNGTFVPSGASEIKYTPKILPELVIRLTGYLYDPHGVQTQTTQLLAGIHAYYENDHHFLEVHQADHADDDPSRYTNTAERRGHLYDLQRYAAAYEAAALYHVATWNYHNHHDNTHEGAEHGKKGNKRPKQGPARKGKDEALNLDDEDGDEIDPDEGETFDAYCDAKSGKSSGGLQIDDLMEASNEYTYLEIMQVLPRVQALAKKLKRFDKISLTNNGRKRTKAHPKVRNDPNQTPRETVKTFVNVEHEDSRSVNEATFKSYFDAEPVVPFSLWKQGILSQVKRHAQTANPHVSDEMAMAISAKAVLQKYGISPLPGIGPVRE